MPQLVKGGKHVFGWSEVGEDGRIVIPYNAFFEYGFIEGENGILMSGSKKSGGFGLTTLKLLSGTLIDGVLKAHPDLAEFKISQGEALHINSKIYCWSPIKNKSIMVSLDTLNLYGVLRGDLLLTVRGSGLALGFIVKGPIIDEARKHLDLKVYK